AATGNSITVPARRSALVVLCVDRIGDQPVLGSLKLIVGHALLDHLGDDRVDRLFRLRQRGPGLRGGVDGEPGLVERGRRIAGARVDRDVLVHHQYVIESAVGAVAQDVSEHRERFALARFGRGGGGDEIIARNAWLGDARIGERDGARRFVHRLLRAHAWADLGDARDLAVDVLGALFDLLGGDVAGDHEDGVVGRVDTLVERERVFAREFFQLLAPA